MEIDEVDNDVVQIQGLLPMDIDEENLDRLINAPAQVNFHVAPTVVLENRVRAQHIYII